MEATPDFRKLFESVPGLYLVLTPELRITAVSDAYAHATMTRRSEILGRDLFDVFPDNPDDPTATGTRNLRQSLQRVLERGAPDAMAIQRYDVRRPSEEGGNFEERYWRPLNVPVKCEAGSIRYIIHRVDDVTDFVLERQQSSAHRARADQLKTLTDRMEAEIYSRAQEIQEVNRSLHEQREVLRRFFTLSLDFLCIAGVDGCFKLINPAFDALGYTRGELLCTPLIEFVHEDDRDLTLSAMRELEGGASTVRFENRYRRKDGSFRWLAWAATPDKSGLVYAVARDITEAKQSEGALVRAKEDMYLANKELEAFSYSVAHDLRAPLRGIDGFSQALLEDYAGAIDEKGAEYLKRITQGSQRMGELIDALLDLSRVTRVELMRQRVNLSQLAASIAVQLRASDPERHVHFICQDELIAEGDPSLLPVLLQNLLANAWKFTAASREPRVEFGLRRTEHGSAFFVADNGAGFDPAHADKLFAPFQRLHTAKEFSGTGVGLATVQRIVRRHEGRVWAEGAVGVGATVYFTLFTARQAGRVSSR